MGWALLLPTWLVSLALLYVEGLAPGGRSALVLLVWLAAAGTPRAGSRVRAWPRAALVVALAAGPLVLAAVLDHAAGAERAVLGGVAPGLVFLVLLSAAATRGGWLYGAFWLGLALAVPILEAALTWDGRRGGSSWPPLEAAAALSPLAWAFRRAAEPAGAQWADLCAGAAVLVLAALALRAEARA